MSTSFGPRPPSRTNADVEFVKVLLRERMVDAALLHRRLDEVTVPEARVTAARHRLSGMTTTG